MARHFDDDDEVQIISEKTWNDCKRDSFICQMCPEDLTDLSARQRQAHYEGHLDTNQSTKAHFKPREPSYSRRTVDRSGFRRNYKDKPYHKWKILRFPCTEDDVFWYNAHTGPPPPNSTPGLVSLLKTALCKSHLRGFTRRAALCHSSTVHVRRDVWDSNWGCGYRNYLMVCSALLCQQTWPEYYPLILNGSRVPGVRNLQQLIQEAWEAGFDQEGQQELKKLVGTSKWIGTSDLYVAFSYCGIPCELIEFNLAESHDRLLDALVNWVIDYFTPKSTSESNDVNEVLRGASPVTVTGCMPLVLQHQGHSRTIVGYEIGKDGRPSLLVFDPSFHVKNQLRDAAMNCFHQANRSKRPISACAESSTYTHPTKRLRSALRINEPIMIDSDDTITDQVTRMAGRIRGGTNSLLPSEEKLSQRLLGVCRLTLAELSKHKRYQILYCTMAPPLSSEEKAARMVVTSMMVS